MSVANKVEVMKWENLRKNKCPQCNKDFMNGLEIKKIENPTGSTQMFIHKCGFKIHEDKFKSIVSNMNSQHIDTNQE